jgi:hypothetical protein
MNEQICPRKNIEAVNEKIVENETKKTKKRRIQNIVQK